MSTTEELSEVKKKECPLKKGDRVWRSISIQQEKQGYAISVNGVAFQPSEKGDFLARLQPAEWRANHTDHDILDWKGGKTKGLVCILPKKFVPLSDDLWGFVVTGISKEGNVVFIAPDPDASRDMFMCSRQFPFMVRWAWETWDEVWKKYTKKEEEIT